MQRQVELVTKAMADEMFMECRYDLRPKATVEGTFVERGCDECPRSRYWERLLSVGMINDKDHSRLCMSCRARLIYAHRPR